MTDVVASGRPYEQFGVAAPAAVAVRRLRDALHERNMTEYAVVDHGHDMAAAGVYAHQAWTLVFGTPAAGEKLLARDLASAVDIPLRLAVIATGPNASAVVVRPMESLLAPELSDLAAAFSGVLRSLAAEAQAEAKSFPGSGRSATRARAAATTPAAADPQLAVRGADSA